MKIVITKRELGHLEEMLNKVNIAGVNSANFVRDIINGKEIPLPKNIELIKKEDSTALYTYKQEKVLEIVEWADGEFVFTFEEDFVVDSVTLYSNIIIDIVEGFSMFAKHIYKVVKSKIDYFTNLYK